MTILHATEHESLRSHMREVSRETLWKDKYAAIKAELTAALLREEVVGNSKRKLRLLRQGRNPRCNNQEDHLQQAPHRPAAHKSEL